MQSNLKPGKLRKKPDIVDLFKVLCCHLLYKKIKELLFSNSFLLLQQVHNHFSLLTKREFFKAFLLRSSSIEEYTSSKNKKKN